MKDGRSTLRLLLTGLLIGIAGCTTTPSPGERFVMTVTQIPTQRQQLQHNPALSLAIERGVSRETVAEKRLMIAGCYDEKPDGSTYRRQVLSLLPPGIAIKPGEVFETTAEKAVADRWTALYFGRYVEARPASTSDYFPFKYAISKRAYRCAASPPANTMVVESYFPVATYLYDDARAEALRNAQITDRELESGRIAIGDCAVGVESWVVWKVRLPPGLEVQPGDYLEAVAGAHEGPSSTGALSIGLRKVAKPPLTDFVASLGRGDFTAKTGNPVPYKVGCGAQAIPLAK